MSKHAELRWCALLGMFALLATHLAWLGSVAGFHYDEAWAALYAHRIATERGFWPLRAMSPYTSAWSHYVAALFFKLFGTSLRVYRASGIALVAAGVAMLCRALERLGEGRAAALLPWVVAFFPVAVANHRFGIEINTFHVFCLGLFAWGASLRLAPRGSAARDLLLSDLMIATSCLLGVTSHVLFVAPMLAAAALALWPERGISPRLRALMGCLLAALFLFFLRIHLLIPEKDKSLALLLVAGICGALILFPSIAEGAPAWARKLALATFYALLAPSLLLLLFFSEGSWSLAYFSGGLHDPRWIGLVLLAPVIAGFSARKSFRAPGNPVLTPVLCWMGLTLVATSALAVKPVPRYFEVPLLLAACALALLLSRCTRRGLALAAVAWIAAGSLQLGFNYFSPGLRGQVQDRTFRFLFFRDTSADVLSKQRLAAKLGALGCRFDQVRTTDPRLEATLRFLALGDWPLANSARCPWPLVRVARSPGSAQPFVFGL